MCLSNKLYAVSADGSTLDKCGAPNIISMWRILPECQSTFLLAIHVVSYKCVPPSTTPGFSTVVTDSDCEVAVHAPEYRGYMFSVNKMDNLYSVLSVTQTVREEGRTVVVYCHRDGDSAAVWYIDRESGRVLQPPHFFRYPAPRPLRVSVCMRAVGARMEIVPAEGIDYSPARIGVWRV